MKASALPLVSTIGERCRVCYQCVRECPAKAIRIADHRAQVIAERCIGCGVCFKVCTQDAKQIVSAIDDVEALLAGPEPVAAILAPSFPAEFIDVEYPSVVGTLRALGFASVHEVAFGAELVALEYKRLVARDTEKLWIATTCPAVTGYVVRYYPDLVSNLAPIVSPMVALARVLKKENPNRRVVFIGPCIAKKREAASVNLDGEVDEALTFVEVRKMIAAHGIDPEKVEPSHFDQPRSREGGLFPISSGMLQVAGIQEDLVSGHVMVAEGPAEFAQAIFEAESGLMDTRLLEVLFCKGCTMGPGMSSDLPHFGRRARVSQYVRRRLAAGDPAAWQRRIAHYSAMVDLARSYTPLDLRLPTPSPERLGAILAEIGKPDPSHELNCGACGYSSCRELATAIARGLAEREMCLPHSVEQLRTAVADLARSNEDLANAQVALVRSEKLASMGQLAAGIAHEVNNPLGVVIMYSHFLAEQLAGKPEYRDDLAMVVEQADRCKKIVAGLLDFARQNKVEHDRIDVGDLVQRGLRGLAHPLGVEIEVEHAVTDRLIEVDPDQITQVLVNLISNAFAAMPNGGRLRIRTEDAGDQVRILVSDTGVGIPPEHFSKLFEPFFTTKKVGKGTGLGLAVTYGIVKMHRGDIKVTSNADPAKGPTGTTFTVILPRRRVDASSAA